MPCRLAAAADLHSAAASDSPVIARLAAGDLFEVLERSGKHAWGVAPGPGLVGYICDSALGEAVE